MPKRKRVATSSEAKSYASDSKSAQRGAGGGSVRKPVPPSKGASPGLPSGTPGGGGAPTGRVPAKSPGDSPRPSGSQGAKAGTKPGAKSAGTPTSGATKGSPTAVSKVPANGSGPGAKPAAGSAPKGASVPPKKGTTTAPPAPGGRAGSPTAAPGTGSASAAAPGGGARPAGKVLSGKPSKKAASDAPPTPAVPRKYPKGGPTKAELRKYRARLLELRQGLLASSKDLAAEALKSPSSEFTVDRTPDSGADNYEQDFSLQLLEGEAAQLADIREALLKIDGKVELPYGICEACSDTDRRLCETCPWIPPSRLDVMPHARLCVQTKEIEERKKQR